MQKPNHSNQIIQTFLFIIVVVLSGVITVPSFAHAGTTNIAACGNLNVANETYVLQNDVSSVGSCFTITASDITLDLNGHTVTYDNNTPIQVLNGSFENGTGAAADNWDFAGAPNIARVAGTYVQPVTVYDGDYAAKISVPATDQQINSLGQITLQPNTTYNISAMLYNNYYVIGSGYQSDSITLFVGLDDGTTEKTASHTGINWRGFQYTSKTFTTGATVETYDLIAGISGASSVVEGNVFIDDIKIQKTKVFGVVVGPAAWAASKYPDIAAYGNASGAIIRNGKIVQGQGLSDYADSIFVEENSGSNFEFDHLEITTKGANAQAIETYNMLNGKIHDCTLHAEVATITSRDGYDGAIIKVEYGGDGGQIYNNIFDKGIQTAIYAHTKSDAANQMQIYGNNITLQTKYTNDFAIVAGGSEIFSNTINCGSGNNSCRGIGIGGSGTEVFNNIVGVQQLARNQEYNGCESSGAYGMQMESNTHGIRVYGNTVTANAGVCEAYAFRANPYAEGGVESYDNLVHDNVFVALTAGSARAANIKYSQLDSDDVSLTNNTFKTNHRWIYLDGGGPVIDPTFVGNRWETMDTLSDPFYPFEAYNNAGTYFSGTFYDNTYGSAQDKTRFESEFFRTSNGSVHATSSFSVMQSDLSIPAAPSGLSVL